MISYISQKGEVFTEHIGNINFDSQGEKNKTSKEIFIRDISWLKASDIIIAEVTIPSLGVGYEIGLAQMMKKPILCLYRKQKNRYISAMLLGNDNIDCHYYLTIMDAKNYIDKFIKIFIENND